MVAATKSGGDASRTKTIKIRVTEAEHVALLERSPKPRLAEWMREHCLEASAPVRRIEPPAVAPELVRQLRAIGINLNQIARVANSAGLNSEVVASLLQCERVLAKIEAQHRAG